MKKRIRKTGEIVDVISFSSFTERHSNDKVSYIDSNGKEILDAELNLFWDFEDVENELTAPINWEQRRYEIAKEIMPTMSERGYRNNGVFVRYGIEEAADKAVAYANALIRKLQENRKRLL